MWTKTITINTNWLNDIDGLTVKQAIEYLKTLNQDHKLSSYLDGDTHGCEMVSDLYYEIPMANSEILERLENKFKKDMALYTAAKVQYLKDDRHNRLESCNTMIEKLNKNIAEARLKYS